MRSWKRRTRYLRKRIFLDHANYKFESEKKSKWWKKRQNKYSDLWPYFPWGVMNWRKNYFFDEKKRDRVYWSDYLRMNKLMSEDGIYVEDCSYHPAKVMTIQGDSKLHRISLDVKSLINGKALSCSYYNCGVVILTKEEAEERRDFMMVYGMDPYIVKYSFNTSDSKNIADNLKEYLYTDLMYVEDVKRLPSVPTITEDGKVWLKDTFDIDYNNIVLEVAKKFKESSNAHSRSSETQ